VHYREVLVKEKIKAFRINESVLEAFRIILLFIAPHTPKMSAVQQQLEASTALMTPENGFDVVIICTNTEKMAQVCGQCSVLAAQMKGC
jgi:hypothetical protein